MTTTPSKTHVHELSLRKGACRFRKPRAMASLSYAALKFLDNLRDAAETVNAAELFVQSFGAQSISLLRSALLQPEGEFCFLLILPRGLPGCGHSVDLHAVMSKDRGRQVERRECYLHVQVRSRE